MPATEAKDTALASMGAGTAEAEPLPVGKDVGNDAEGEGVVKRGDVDAERVVAAVPVAVVERVAGAKGEALTRARRDGVGDALALTSARRVGVADGVAVGDGEGVAEGEKVGEEEGEGVPLEEASAPGVTAHNPLVSTAHSGVGAGSHGGNDTPWYAVPAGAVDKVTTFPAPGPVMGTRKSAGTQYLVTRHVQDVA